MAVETGLLAFYFLFGLVTAGTHVRSLNTYVCPQTPCVRKCCPEEQVWDYVKAVCKPSPVPHSFFLQEFFNESFTEAPALVFGNGCPADSEMIPQVNDPQQHEFLPNGQVLISGKKLNVDDYCVDYVDSDNTLGKVLFICSFRRSADQLSLLDMEDSSKVEKIPLQKCCEGPLFYSPVNKKCEELNETVRFWPPPVLSTSDNQELNLPEEAFHITHSNANCPPGYLRSSSTNFTLYDDGSVSIENRPYTLRNATFCAEALDDTDYPNPFFAKNVVEYCKEDPCRDGTACVKKCCSLGYMIDLTTGELKCALSDEKFTPEFRDPANDSVVLNSVQYILRDGSMPVCPEGMNLIDPETYPNEQFYLLPTSGNLYIPHYPAENDREQSEYCVDNFNMGANISLKVFICFPEQPVPDPAINVALTVYPIVMSISVVFLVITFLVYAVLPELQNLHGLTIMCHVFCLIVTFVSLSIIQTGAANNTTAFCISTAIVAHFFFLSTFTWLNVMGFDLWLTFRDMRPRNIPSFKRKMKRFGFYSLFAWGIPLVIVVVGQILDHSSNISTSVIKPGFGEISCWFKGSIELLVYFYGPIGICIFTNIVFFVLTALKLYQASKEAAFAAQNSSKKERFRIILYLFVLMGVFWIVEIISFAAKGTSAYIWILFDLINILTGVFIFMIFVCKRQVIKLLRKRISLFDRCWRTITKNHPEWNRSTDPKSATTTKHSASHTVTSSDPKRVTSSTSVTNVFTHDMHSELPDTESTQLNVKTSPQADD